MDYGELATCIADLEWWADKLDDELRSPYNWKNWTIHLFFWINFQIILIYEWYTLT
jgi:hypothetical protein